MIIIITIMTNTHTHTNTNTSTTTTTTTSTTTTTNNNNNNNDNNDTNIYHNRPPAGSPGRPPRRPAPPMFILNATSVVNSRWIPVEFALQ